MSTAGLQPAGRGNTHPNNDGVHGRASGQRWFGRRQVGGGRGHRVTGGLNAMEHGSGGKEGAARLRRKAARRPCR